MTDKNNNGRNKIVKGAPNTLPKPRLKLIETNYVFALILANFLIVIFALFNPYNLTLGLLWELAALGSTFFTVVLIWIDGLYDGDNQLKSALTPAKHLSLITWYLVFLLIIAMSVWAATGLPTLNHWPVVGFLHPYAIKVHAIILFLGAICAVRISHFYSKLEINSNLTEEKITQIRPLFLAEKRHAVLSKYYIDIPSLIAFFVILLVVCFHGASEENEIILKSFMGGSVAFSLLLANSAYILTRIQHEELDNVHE